MRKRDEDSGDLLAPGLRLSVTCMRTEGACRDFGWQLGFGGSVGCDMSHAPELEKDCVPPFSAQQAQLTHLAQGQQSPERHGDAERIGNCTIAVFRRQSPHVRRTRSGHASCVLFGTYRNHHAALAHGRAPVPRDLVARPLPGAASCALVRATQPYPPCKAIKGLSTSMHLGFRLDRPVYTLQCHPLPTQATKPGLEHVTASNGAAAHTHPCGA